MVILRLCPLLTSPALTTKHVGWQDIVLVHSNYFLFSSVHCQELWFRWHPCFPDIERGGLFGQVGDLWPVGPCPPVLYTAIPPEIWPPPRAQAGSRDFSWQCRLWLFSGPRDPCLLPSLGGFLFLLVLLPFQASCFSAHLALWLSWSWAFIKHREGGNISLLRLSFLLNKQTKIPETV